MRKYCLIILLTLVPNLVLAVDMGKGLLESKENLISDNLFLKGGAELVISPATAYPVPIFGGITSRSLNFELKTDKEVYQAGDAVQFEITVNNAGYFSNEVPPERQKQRIPNIKLTGNKLFYLWVAGNFYVEVFRLSDKVKDGELLVATGKAYADDNLSVFQNETEKFNFSWEIPANAKAGDYEIRIYPSSKSILFLGAPNAYRTSLKTSIKINNEKDKEERTGWKLEELKLGEETVRLKAKELRLKAGNDYALSVPIENLGDSPKNLVIVKQTHNFSPNYGSLLSEELEKITLEPNEKKIIVYNIGQSNIQGKAGIMASVSFAGDSGGEKPTKRGYSDYPIAKLAGETIMVPLYVIGNADFRLRGMGVTTIEDQTIFKPDSYVSIFIEIERADRLFYESGETKRKKEDNIKINLAFLDRDGNKLEEIGYEGPSWDRSGMVSKTIKLKGKNDYFKLVGALSSSDRGEIFKKEIEYFAPVGATPGLFDRLKEIWEDHRMVLVGLAVIVLGVIIILTTAFVARKKESAV